MRRIGLGVLLALFLAACGTTEPQVGSWVGSVSFSPEDGAEEVPVDTNLVVTYDFSVGDEDVSLTDHDSTFTVQAQETASSQLNAAQVSGTTVLDEEAGTLTFDPDEDLDHGTTYQVTLEGSVTTSDGEEFSGVTSWSFTTVAGMSIGGPGGGDGPITIDDSGRGTPDVPVDNDTDSQIDVTVVCEDADGNPADGFSLDPGTADAVTVTDQTVVADLDVVEDGTYTCTITATDGETSVSEEVTVVVDTSDDEGDGGAEPGFDLPTDGGDIEVGDDDTGESTLNVDRDTGHDGDIEFAATCEIDGITLSFDPNPASGGIDQTTITANVGPDVPNGSYDCTVTATDTETGESEVTTVTVVVDRTVDGLALPEDGQLSVTIDDSNDGSVDFTVDRVDGFEGQIFVVGSCSQAGLGIDSLVEDPDTTDGYTVTVALENPDNGLSNGTYPGACELTASADGSSDATTTVDVVVDRTIEGFQLPGSDGSGITVTIDDENDPATRELSIARADGFDAEVTLSGSCTPTGLGIGLDPSSTSGNSSTMTVSADASVANGTYENACEITGSAAGSEDATTDVTVIVDRTVDGIDLGTPDGEPLAFVIDDSSDSDTESVQVSRANGFDGAVDVTGTCVSEDGLTFDPLTIASDATTGDLTVTAATGVLNGTYDCSVTASGEGSFDATLDATVEVDRTVDGIELGTLDGEPLAFTIDDTSDSDSETLQVSRANGFDGAVDVTGTCASEDGLTFAPDPLTIASDATTGDITVTAASVVLNGTYDCTLTASGEGSFDATLDATVDVDRTVDGIDLGTPNGDPLAFVIDDTSDSDTESVEVSRANGFDGAVDVTGSCVSEDGLTFDPLTIASDATTGDLTVTAATDVRNGTYDCTLTASGEGSSDDTLAATVDVNRTVDDFTLPAANAVTIQVGNDGTGSGTLTIDRDDIVADTALDLSASNCDAGIDLTFGDDPTTGDAVLNVTVDGTVTNGTYHCDVTVTNPETGESDTTTVEIVVEFDQFAFSSNPMSVSYEEGETHNDTLAIVRDADHPEVDVDVAVSCDAALTFDPTTGTLAGTDTDYAFTLSGGTSGNTYTCDVTGTSARGEVEETTLEVTVVEPATPTCSNLVDVVYEPTSYTYGSGTGLIVPAPELVFENEPDCQEPDGVTFSVASYSPNAFTTFFELQADGTIHKIKSNNPQGNPLFEVTVAAEFGGTTVTSNQITISTQGQ